MLTPQSNTTLEEIAQTIAHYQSFAICGHVSPDGDCLGSQLALYHMLRLLDKEVVCLLAGTDPLENNLKFLPGLDTMVVGSDYHGTPEVFIAVDVPTRERIKRAAPVAERAALTITIDHHANPVAVSDLNYVDPDVPAAAMLVWKLCKLLGAPSSEVALCCLTGLITDTGRFSYQNTTAEAFVLAAEMVSAGASPAYISREFYQNRSIPSLKLEQRVLQRMQLVQEGAFSFSYITLEDFKECGAIKADAGVLIDVLRDIKDVRVALILRENSESEVRGSLRAKDDTDVSIVARQYDGGGHRGAAGFTFKGSLTQALAEVPSLVTECCFVDNPVSDSMNG